jgi:hypothetical protein
MGGTEGNELLPSNGFVVRSNNEAGVIPFSFP